MADNMQLKLGDDIKGESPIGGYEEWIQVHGWGWSATQSGTTHEGMGGTSGKVTVQDMTVTKFVDASTHDIIKHVCNGLHIPYAELHVLRVDGMGGFPYLIIKMTDVIVSAYSTSGSQDGLERVSETLSLNFGKVEVTYTIQNNDGSAGAESTAGWDIRANEPI